MFRCPACNSPKTAARLRCCCGVDLTLLHDLEAVADAYYNRGLRCLGEDRYGRALEWFAACRAVRPPDAGALRGMAVAWARLGHATESRAALDRARVLDPDAPGLASLTALIDAAALPEGTGAGDSSAVSERSGGGDDLLDDPGDCASSGALTEGSEQL